MIKNILIVADANKSNAMYVANSQYILEAFNNLGDYLFNVEAHDADGNVYWVCDGNYCDDMLQPLVDSGLLFANVEQSTLSKVLETNNLTQV